MADGAEALRGEWRRDYGPWRAGFDAFFEERDSTEVRILSWGPGEHTPYYEKRHSICADLATRASNSVFTSEQLFESEPRFSSLEDALLAEEADIVICLVVDDPEVSGAPAEMLEFRKHPGIAHKIRLLLPKEARRIGQGFLYQGCQQFPSSQTFRYTARQYKQCDDIRAKCHRWVEAVRRQKHLERWRKKA
jgi:hypothetical protein